MKANFTPRPGHRAGELEFRFRRSGYTLSVDLSLPNGHPWINVSMWMRNVQSCQQPVFAHSSIADCRLTGSRTLSLRSGDVETDPTLWVGGTGFALRPAEYEALRDHLLIHGLVHHVNAESPIEAAALRLQAPAPLSREYEGEVEGCGGDAELNRHL